MTSPQRNDSRDNNFDFLRFLGALLVFVSHATWVPSGTLWTDPLYQLSGGQMTIGWIGVGMFFAISGYLVTASWERRAEARAFLRARAVRIYPALIFVVLAIFLIGGAISTAPGYFRSADALQYLGNIVVPFSDNRLPGVFQDLPSAGVSDNLWTLRYEIGCYVLLVIMGSLGVWRRDTVLVLFLLTSLIFALGGRDASNGWVDLPRYFMAGAVVWLFRDRIPWRGSLALVSLVALALSTQTPFMKLAFGVFGTYLTLYLAFAPWLRLRRFGKYGDFSYGLYLSGLFVQQLVQRTNPQMGVWENSLVAFPITMTVAVAMWYTIEKPALALKKPRTRAPLPAPAARTATPTRGEPQPEYAVRRTTPPPRGPRP